MCLNGRAPQLDTFFDACGETLSHVINTVADVLHIPYTEAHHERRGDLKDGPITATDAFIALRMVVRGEHNDAADMNDGGRVTSVNALMILQTAAVGLGYGDRRDRIDFWRC